MTTETTKIRVIAVSLTLLLALFAQTNIFKKILTLLKKCCHLESTQGERCNWSLPRPSLSQNAFQKKPSSSWTRLHSEALPKHYWGSGRNKTDLGPASAR